MKYLILVIILLNCKFLEAGFDDGPFYPKKIQLVNEFIILEEIPYRKGSILNIKNINKKPVLAYKESNEILWAFELETESTIPNTSLTEISNLKIKEGFIKDEIEFTGKWTFGAEKGRAIIGKNSELKYFYLSW